jgi:hypothetical protein
MDSDGVEEEGGNNEEAAGMNWDRDATPWES